MQRFNVRVTYDREIPATEDMITRIATNHNGVWWHQKYLSEKRTEGNFAFWHHENAFGFMMRVNCLRTADAVIDFKQQVEEKN